MPYVAYSNVIEGFFISSLDNLIFDVKGVSHPKDRIIAFIRYVPSERSEARKDDRHKGFKKLYDLNERFAFLKKHYPYYIFDDPKGRGLLQAVPHNLLKKVHDPCTRLSQIFAVDEPNRDPLERLVVDLANQIVSLGGIDHQMIGVSGSVLINLHGEHSDIDLVVYGRESGLKVYNAMPKVFDSSPNIRRYTREELRILWQARGQDNQISFDSFFNLEKDKHLQGKISGRDFYIRLILFPEEFFEPYDKTIITSLGEVQIEATIADDRNCIYTPCVYFLTDVEIVTGQGICNVIPDRLFSVRGRYCELAETGSRVLVRGKLEQVKIEGGEEYVQLTIGATPNEFFRRKQ